MMKTVMTLFSANGKEGFSMEKKKENKRKFT